MKKIAIVLTLMFLFETSSAVASSSEKKAPCRLEVDNAHISKNIRLKEAKSVVKVKFHSICNLEQRNLTLNVQILKAGAIFPIPASPLITRRFPLVKANQEILIQDIFIYCKNTLRTTYFGVASASAYISGKKVYANKVESKLKVNLLCGT